MVPRISGSLIDKNAIGYSVSVMVGTIKRVFVVLYPPMLGWLSVHDVESFRLSFFICYFFALIALFLVFLLRRRMIIFFVDFIASYNLSHGFFRSMAAAFYGVHKEKVSFGDSAGGVDVGLVFLSAWIYFIYGSSLFLVNILGFLYGSYSAIIYQMVGVVSALGTLVFAFVLDPKLARISEAGSGMLVAHNSLLLGQFLSMGFLGPAMIYSVFLFYGL